MTPALRLRVACNGWAILPYVPIQLQVRCASLIVKNHSRVVLLSRFCTFIVVQKHQRFNKTSKWFWVSLTHCGGLAPHSWKTIFRLFNVLDIKSYYRPVSSHTRPSAFVRPAFLYQPTQQLTTAPLKSYDTLMWTQQLCALKWIRFHTQVTIF